MRIFQVCSVGNTRAMPGNSGNLLRGSRARFKYSRVELEAKEISTTSLFRLFIAIVVLILIIIHNLVLHSTDLGDISIDFKFR